tara:strand:- start:1145 stop:1285 length:141 start_codon:yes stop_codon:yes gene_type:complete
MVKLFYIGQYIAFPLAMYLTMTNTLHDMTVTDCNAGIELACKEVAK